MPWQKIADHTVLECAEFKWGLEEYRDGDKQIMFLHLTVHKWSKDVLSKMRALWHTFRQTVTCPLYVMNPDEDDKWSHFVTFFGFKPSNEILCENGERRRLFVHYADLSRKNNNGQQVLRDAATAAVSEPDHYAEPMGSPV